MKYHVLFVNFEKSGKICNCRLLQIIGGALRVKSVNLNLNLCVFLLTFSNMLMLEQHVH